MKKKKFEIRRSLGEEIEETWHFARGIYQEKTKKLKDLNINKYIENVFSDLYCLIPKSNLIA